MLSRLCFKLFRMVLSHVCLTQIHFTLQNFVTFVYLDSSPAEQKATSVQQAVTG